MSTLYLVATPIGNLEDISARALRVLREVTLIAAEDTRHTGKLLAHFEITTPQTSYFEHNKLAKLDHILAKLAGADIALVSDAGTPALNDPGYELVRAALEAGHVVSPIPGPSAPIAALVASGLPTDRFLYWGYLPRKAGERRKALAEVADLPFTLIFLETPHRLLESLLDLRDTLGDRQMAVARELTKLHEEIFRGTMVEATAHFSAQTPKGEITLVVAGVTPKAVRWSPEQVQEVLKTEIARGAAASQIAKEIAKKSSWARREIYQMVMDLQPGQDGE